MSYDLVCAGPVSLDVTFAGVPELPRPGEERFARELVLAPGAFATIAIAGARLGLRTALAAPVPGDVLGRFVREAVSAEGVDWLGPPAAHAPVTVVVPLAGERAMLTYDPGPSPTAGPPVLPASRAVVCGAGDVPDVAPDAWTYVVVGDVDARPWPRHAPPGLERARALLANASEARRMTGERGAEPAARALARHVATAVVTLGPEGALAAEGEYLARVPAPAVAAVDTTGAGDVFTAAYVFADLTGRPLEERLRIAAAAAALSVRRVSASAGAPALAELEAALSGAIG